MEVDIGQGNKEKLLEEARKLEMLVETPGWRDVLKPWLESRCHHAWEDPQNAEDLEKFFYRYTVQWAKAESANQVLQKVEGTIAHAAVVIERDKEKAGKERG